ncbi:MAG: hypothetical protein KAT17_04375 [Candidatus Aminicenantes bacterium]|nr:hypothetical protein [Candidatus Aminicenantes bacterium]
MKKRTWLGLAIISLLSLVVEFSMHHDSAHHHWWNDIPAFWISFGFAGCVILILFAKTLGKLFLNKKENYYDVE